MPNIHNSLKDEIARLARKEIRGQTTAVKKTISHQREAISKLREKVIGLERELHTLSKGTNRAIKEKAMADKGSRSESTLDVATWRRTMGLTLDQAALLFETNRNSVYLWERGTKPHSASMAKIQVVMLLGEREIRRRLKDGGLS